MYSSCWQLWLLICVNTSTVLFSNITFKKNTKGWNHLEIIKVTLAKWLLYKEWRAPSGHDTKKGRTKSTRDYETRESRKEPETNHEQKSGQKKKEENKHSDIRDGFAKKQQSVIWRLEIDLERLKIESCRTTIISAVYSLFIRVFIWVVFYVRK